MSVLIGCSPGAIKEGYVSTRDSAGIRIDTYGNIGDMAAANPHPVHINDVEEIGSPAGGALLGNGVIAIADRADNSIALLDRDGSLTGRIARKGIGPGEFSRMSWLRRVSGDTLAVYDDALRRVTWYRGSDLLSVEQLDIPPTALWLTVTPASTAQYILLQTQPLHSSAQPGGFPTVVSVDEMQRSSRKPLLTIPGSDAYRFVDNSGGPTFTGIVDAPLARRTLIAARESIVVVVTSADFEYRMYEKGMLTRIVRAEIARSRITDDSLRTYKPRFTSAGSALWQNVRAKVFGQARFPEYAPAIDSVLITESGGVWVRQFTFSDSERWYAFHRDGVIDVVTLPRGRIADVRNDEILMFITNDVDVEQPAIVKRTRP